MKNPMGYTACPECGFPDAEVGNTKNGLPYRFCPDCNAQYFPRTADTAARLTAKMRPVTVPGTEPPAPIPNAPAPAPAPEPPPPRKGLLEAFRDKAA